MKILAVVAAFTMLAVVFCGVYRHHVQYEATRQRELQEERDETRAILERLADAISKSNADFEATMKEARKHTGRL